MCNPIFINFMLRPYVCIVRQLEQRVKLILDQIGTDESKKRELIRGGAVDKAEQLSMSK